MQGESSSVESLPETFEFDHGSSSNNSGLDQQIYWDNMLNQVETQSLPNYLLPPSVASNSYMNMDSQENASLSIWNSDRPSSSEHPLNQGGHDETKMEHEWTSLTINPGGRPRIEERRVGGRRFDTASMLSLENVNINLNSVQVDDAEIFSQNSHMNEVLQNPEHIAAGGAISSEVSESGLCPHPISGILKFEHDPSSSDSSNACINSSGVGFMSEDVDDRPGSSLDGRRIACKRKNIEGFPGQSSASGSPNFFEQTESSLLHSVPASHSAGTSITLSRSSDYISGANSSEEQLNPRLGIVMRGAASDCYPSPNVAANMESSRRNFRMRINPARQPDISPSSLYTQGNAIRRSSLWLPNQPSSLIPLNQPLESRPVIGSSSSQNQPHMPIFPGLPRNMPPSPWNGASSSRTTNSSNSISLEERSISTIDETNSGSIPRINFSDHSVLVPPTDIRHLVQDPTNWSSENGRRSLDGNAPNSVVHPVVGPSWLASQNPPVQYPRSSSEVVRRSLFPSGGLDSGGQSSNFPLQRSGRSSISPETSQQPAAGFRGHQQPYMRSAFLIERQSDGVLGVPLSMRSLAAAREGRSRMISEIRNALDLMRRGENLRFEDVFILDQSVFNGGADLHDRHRDMRLDVDNMSYEELLALEERIGNVSTGLNEETVLKCLKRRAHLSVRGAEASMEEEEEQCCICREEYIKGEELGALDCGHGFHTACIKQWLMLKNLCPICKTTGLVT